MRVAITGAHGFVGSTLTRSLVAAGWDVHPLDLRAGPSTGPGLAHTGGVPIRAFDITAGPLPAAPAVDVVVHVAAYVSDTGPLALARAVNVTGTENVVASFPEARFVHVSSCSVYDPHAPQRNATEDQAPAPDAVRWSNAYGRTKSQAEVRLRELRPDAIVLRPHAVYGPGDTTVMPRLREAARRGRIPLPHGGVQFHSITHVGNLAQACRLAALPAAPAGTYNVNDGDPVPLREAIAQIAAIGGTPPRIIDVPVPVLMGVATVLEAAAATRARVTGRPVHPQLSRYSVEHLALERTFDITAARERLGYQPAPTDLTSATDW